MKKYRIIDADGHCVERDAELSEYAEHLGVSLKGASGVGAMPFFPSLDGWFRVASDKLSPGDPAGWARFLDATGIELTVLHPTSGLAYGLVQDPEWATSLARAYNDWLYHRYMRQDRRFRGVALLPLHRIEDGVRELRRAVTELGMSGGVLPTSTVLHKAYGHPHFYPIYEEALRLDCVLTLHGAPSRGMGFDFFDTFIKTHTLEHPVAMMIQFTSMMFDGVFERFPGLRFAFYEAGIGWVPYLMDRMDEEFERRGRRWAPLLKKPPSAYVREGSLYFSAEVEEKMLPYALSVVGEDKVLFASDFPHERDPEELEQDVDRLAGRADLTDDLKRKLLFDNANRFYKFGL